MMKKILCLFLSICTVIPVLLGFSFDIYADDSYQYTLEEGLLTVTGSGRMGTETAALADYPWHSFRDSITEWWWATASRRWGRTPSPPVRT